MKHTIHFILCIAFSIMLLANTAFSQEEEFVLKDDEKAICSFLRLSGQEPDIEKWILGSQKYIDADKFDKRDILAEDKIRLDKGCKQLKIESDVIKIHNKILLSKVVENGETFLTTQFLEKNKNAILYFSYTYGEHFIIAVPKNFDPFKKIKLKPEQITTDVGYLQEGVPYQATMEIRLKPVSADASAKIEVDGKERWIMITEIAHVDIKNRHKFLSTMATIWDYSASWYFDESQKTLLEHFRGNTP